MKMYIDADGAFHIEAGEVLVDRDGGAIWIDQTVLAAHKTIMRDMIVWGVPFPWRTRLRILLRGRP